MKAHRRLAGSLMLFILVMSLAAAVPASHPPPARAGGIIPHHPCDLIPDGAARIACMGVTGPVGTAVGAIPGIPSPTAVVGDVAQAIVQPILNQIAQAEADAVESVLKDTTRFVNSSTKPTLTADWFLRIYAIVFGIAVLMGLVLFYARIAGAARNQDAGDAGGAFVSMTGLIVLGGLLPGIVALTVVFLDNHVAPGWMDIAGTGANDTLNNLGVDFSKSISASNNPVTPILLPLIFLFVGLIGGIMIELMLLFRLAMLYVMTAAEIVAFAMLVGGQMSNSVFFSTTRKLAVLCCFKVIVAFILTIGILLLGSGGASPILMGSVVLLMVPILSWGAYRNWGGHDIRFMPGATGHINRAANYVKD